ncbi:MAG: transposase [Propionibacteriaceae bacterium]|nr:transposase [Propionibacteriaceae bacterium]
MLRWGHGDHQRAVRPGRGPLLPVQRGNVKINNYTFVNAVLWIVRAGCPWRGLPKEFGRWHSVCRRFSRWAYAGVVERLSAALQSERITASNSVDTP